MTPWTAACQASLSITISWACSNSCPSHQWCHLTISSSSPSLPTLNLFQHQGLFQGVSSSHQVAKVLEFQLQHQSFQWIFRVDFLKDWLVWSPCSPRDSQESSSAPQFKCISSSVLSVFFTVQFSHQNMTTGKTIALTRWTFVGKVMSLLFNTFSWFILGFLGSSAGKKSACNAGDPGSIPGLGRSSGEGLGYPLQYSCLENSMDGGVWWATVRGITKSQTQLSD